ncbi:MAG: pyridoxine 5'-phosphate synthase [Bacteriovoracaceae bacterium]
MGSRLGVNIDHVATVRQARGENYPLITRAAIDAIKAGADQITVHLREDRRHIQDFDVFDVRKITKEMNRLLNFEMAASDEMAQIALKIVPDWICIVPEKREEKTTEGGLNLKNENTFKQVEKICRLIKEKNSKIYISLFLEADLISLEKAKMLKADAVEVHTGAYAKAFLEKKNYDSYVKAFEDAKAFLEKHKIACHAGHGLTLDSVKPLVKLNLFSEYNIGHWIISEAIFQGLTPVISELKKVLK